LQIILDSPRREATGELVVRKISAKKQIKIKITTYEINTQFQNLKNIKLC